MEVADKLALALAFIGQNLTDFKRSNWIVQ